ncbi:MAG: hypothetical protein LCH57_01755 [Proteobacteria bacterium]|nr:hypothetical protein [Pseudomonadota bacterium]
MIGPAEIRIRRVVRQALRGPVTTQEAERLFRFSGPAARDPAAQALRARRALLRLERQTLLRRTPGGWVATDQGRAWLQAASDPTTRPDPFAPRSPR